VKAEALDPPRPVAQSPAEPFYRTILRGITDAAPMAGCEREGVLHLRDSQGGAGPPFPCLPWEIQPRAEDP